MLRPKRHSSDPPKNFQTHALQGKNDRFVGHFDRLCVWEFSQPRPAGLKFLLHHITLTKKRYKPPHYEGVFGIDIAEFV